MSETYDMIELPLGLDKCEMGVDLDLSASLTIVMGNPKKREKPIGSTMACVPVTMAAIANVTLTILKVGRRKFMIERDEDYIVWLTEQRQKGIYKGCFAKICPTIKDVKNLTPCENRSCPCRLVA